MKKSLGAKTCLYPTPVLIIGTYDREGKPDAMTAAWGGICCSSPPCVTISIREATYTYKNITEQKCYTINIPSEKYIEEADYFGIVTGEKTDKLAETGLTPVKSELINAPYIKEFPVILECKLLHTFNIGLHTQFIGEILDVKIEEECLDKNTIPIIEKISPVLYAPLSSEYYGTGTYLGKAFTIGKKVIKK